MPRHETYVCRLKKALYGPKQGPHAWHSRIDEYLLGLGFTITATDNNLYFLFDKFDMLVLVMYVEDLIVIGSSKKLIAWCKTKLTCKFDMEDIGLVYYLLGLEVWQYPGEVFVRQGK